MSNATALFAAAIIGLSIVFGHGISAAAFLGMLDETMGVEIDASSPADPYYSPLQPSVMEEVQ